MNTHPGWRINRGMFWALLLPLLALPGAMLADGKMFVTEKVPPTIPYQRALIVFRDGTQTLVLQSKYAIPADGGEPVAIGWVVPVPAPPEVASMPADMASSLFRDLSFSSHPRVTKISIVLTVLIFCLMPLIILASIYSRELHLPPWLVGHRSLVFRLAIYLLVITTLAGMLLPSLGISSVEVIAEHRVGIYEVQVIRSSTADELIAWLNAHEFKFGEEDRQAFASYLSRGWCFVVAKINPTAEHREREVAADGLAAPLILRFPHSHPVYPLALTGTGGHDTEVLIYLATDTKMSCDQHLPRRFGGSLSSHRLNGLLAAEPEGFFTPESLAVSYLGKFKGVLRPADMSDDLDFAPAPDQPDHREHVLRW